MPRLTIIHEHEVNENDLEGFPERQAYLNLLETVEGFRQRYCVSASAVEIIAEIRALVTPFDLWLLSRDDVYKIYDERLEGGIYRAAKKSFHEMVTVGCPDGEQLWQARKRRDVAMLISGMERDGRGRPQIYNDPLLEKLVLSIERIAGRHFSYSRSRNTTKKSELPETGPPAGEMMDLLIAMIDWLWRVAEMSGFPTRRTAKAESVLSRYKVLKARSSEKTD